MQYVHVYEGKAVIDVELGVMFVVIFGVVDVGHMKSDAGVVHDPTDAHYQHVQYKRVIVCGVHKWRGV